MSETKWKKSNKTAESFTDANQMEIKIQRIRGKKKGFSKLPVLDNIYEPEIAPEPEIVPKPEELKDPEIVSKFIPGPDKVTEGFDDTSSPPVARLPDAIDIKQQVQSKKDQFRDFVKEYGQYLDIFYVVDLGLNATREKVEESIYYIIGIEDATSGFLEFSKTYSPVLMKDIFNEKTDTLIEDLWSNADADLKNKYEDAAKKLNEKRNQLIKDARNDSNVIIYVLRFYVMTIIGILMSYNVLYTWITSRGKTEDSSEPASATAAVAATGVFKIFRIIYEIPITAMKFLKFALKTQGDLIKNALSPVLIYLITIVLFTTCGMVDLAQRISRGMTDSLTAISNGKFESNVWMYVFIVFFWIIDAIWTVVESPFTWIGLIAGTVLFITYLIIIIVNTTVFASVFNILISFYVIYRLILLIPIRRDFQTYTAFGEVNSAAKPPDDEELNSHRYKPLNFVSLRKYVLTLTFLFENFFSFIFIIVSLLSTIILGKNLKFKSLKTTLPIVMMAMIIAFIKYKYEVLFNPESKPAAAWEGAPLDSNIEFKEKIA